jgi:cytochrome c oxidase subunit II
MNVDLYERLWMGAVAVMLALFFTTMAVAEFGHHMQPPSHVETIDPRGALSDQRLQPQGVSVDGQGKIHARVVGLMFAWLPSELSLPADTPVTFHLTSADVTHGFEIVRTNGQTMVLPGYISQFTTQFAAGEYLIACNEYCGVGHHMMAAKLHVVPASQWTRPAAAGQAPTPTTATEAPHGH